MVMVQNKAWTLVKGLRVSTKISKKNLKTTGCRGNSGLTIKNVIMDTLVVVCQFFYGISWTSYLFTTLTKLTEILGMSTSSFDCLINFIRNVHFIS